MRLIRRRLLARLTTFIAAGVAALAFIGSPASAHGTGGGGDSTNFLTTVLEDGADGLVWKVYGGDAFIELTNRTGETVTVFGYQQEPYLRFDESGRVYENQRSPTAYLNRERYGNVDVPTIANGSAPPEWRQIGNDGRYAWHDHRAHWMSPTSPAAVADDPDVEQVVVEWTIPMELADPSRAVAASGELRWVPGVSPWPPLVILGLLFLVVIATVAALTRPRDGRVPLVMRATAMILGAVCVANVLRTVDDVVALPASPGERVATAMWAVGGLTLIAAVGVVAWMARPAALIAVGVAGLLIMLLFGSSASAQLTDSQIATVLPVWVRRWTVAASWMAVVPAFFATVLGATAYSRHLARTAPEGGLVTTEVSSA